jgi:hypothetical protein
MPEPFPPPVEPDMAPPVLFNDRGANPLKVEKPLPGGLLFIPPLRVKLVGVRSPAGDPIKLAWLRGVEAPSALTLPFIVGVSPNTEDPRRGVNEAVGEPVLEGGVKVGLERVNDWGEPITRGATEELPLPNGLPPLREKLLPPREKPLPPREKLLPPREKLPPPRETLPPTREKPPPRLPIEPPCEIGPRVSWTSACAASTPASRKHERAISQHLDLMVFIAVPGVGGDEGFCAATNCFLFKF